MSTCMSKNCHRADVNFRAFRLTYSRLFLGFFLLLKTVSAAPPLLPITAYCSVSILLDLPVEKTVTVSESADRLASIGHSSPSPQSNKHLETCRHHRFHRQPPHRGRFLPASFLLFQTLLFTILHLSRRALLSLLSDRELKPRTN